MLDAVEREGKKKKSTSTKGLIFPEFILYITIY